MEVVLRFFIEQKGGGYFVPTISLFCSVHLCFFQEQTSARQRGFHREQHRVLDLPIEEEEATIGGGGLGVYLFSFFSFSTACYQVTVRVKNQSSTARVFRYLSYSGSC